MTTKVDDFLAHYGVLGMHWGVTRTRSSPGAALKVKTKALIDKKKTTGYDKLGRKTRGGQYAKPKANELSDSELRSRVNRINMEQQYSKLTAKPKSGLVKNGEKQVGKFFKKYGLNIAMGAISLGLAAMAVKSPGTARANAYRVQNLLTQGTPKVIKLIN